MNHQGDNKKHSTSGVPVYMYTSQTNQSSLCVCFYDIGHAKVPPAWRGLEYTVCTSAVNGLNVQLQMHSHGLKWTSVV